MQIILSHLKDVCNKIKEIFLTKGSGDHQKILQSKFKSLNFQSIVFYFHSSFHHNDAALLIHLNNYS